MDPAIARVIWPDEKESSARSLIENLAGMRKRTTSDFIAYLNMLFAKQSSKDVALAVFTDDDTKMALVQHVPTEFLWKVGSYRMGAARKLSEEVNSSQDHVDVAGMKSIVDGQLTEFRKLLATSSKEIKDSLTEMRSIKSSVAELARSVEAHRAESRTWSESFNKVLEKVFGYVSSPQKQSPDIASTLGSINMDLKGLIIDSQGIPRSDSMRNAVARGVGGYSWSGK